MRKARKPKRMRSNKPTLSGNPPLMYLNSFFCPVCGRHLFSFYDGDLKRKDYKFQIAPDWNYCSKCGTRLDLDEWKVKPGSSAEEEIDWEE